MIGRAGHALNSRTLQLYGKDQGCSNQIASSNHGILLGCWIGACLNIISLWMWHSRMIDFVHQYPADLLTFVGSKTSWKKPCRLHLSQFMGLICKVETYAKKGWLRTQWRMLSGVGASCIYPLLGCARNPKWHFLGTGNHGWFQYMIDWILTRHE